MGHYEYSGIPPKIPVENVYAVIRTLSEELWGDHVKPEMLDGIPIGKGDNRLAKWVFHPDEPGWGDAAFSISLIKRDGSLLLEFKMPVSDEGKQWQRQIRFKLAARLRKMVEKGTPKKRTPKKNVSRKRRKVARLRKSKSF